VKDRGTLSPTATLIRKAEAACSDFVQTRVDKLSPAVRERLGFVDGPALNKPANLVYGVEDKPPIQVKWFSAVQQVAILSIYMLYPLILARQAGLQTGEIINILQFGCVVLGVGTVLQAFPRGPVGSRLLAPSVFSGIYLASSMAAVKAGGMPLVWGMTIVAGIVEMALSVVWRRLRAFVPPESAGLIVFFIGSLIALAACHMLLAEGPAGSATLNEWLIAIATIAAMIGLHVWSASGLKIYCVVIGMIFGFVLSFWAGLLTRGDLGAIFELPLVSFPSSAHLSWTFDWSLVLPFAITGLAAAMSATAVLTTYQKAVDADWVRPDMSSIGRGVLGDGMATTLSGALGTYGVTLSNANAGLVAATAAGHPDADAAAGDGGCDAVHRRLHHDQRASDHYVARARRPSHAGDRHGAHDILRRNGLPYRVLGRAAVGATRCRHAFGARDPRRARPQPRIPHRRKEARVDDHRCLRACPARGDRLHRKECRHLGCATGRHKPRRIRDPTDARGHNCLLCR
jgi:xanthine/uracil permease